MAGVIVHINQNELRAFLKSQEIVGAMTPYAERIKSAADQGSGSVGDHEVRTFIGFDRASLVVATVTPEAMLAEMNERNLTRATEAGRG